MLNGILWSLVIKHRLLVKSVYQKINFLISQPKHMLLVLRRTASMRQFFWAPKTYDKIDGSRNIKNLLFYAQKFGLS